MTNISLYCPSCKKSVYALDVSFTDGALENRAKALLKCGHVVILSNVVVWGVSDTFRGVKVQEVEK